MHFINEIFNWVYYLMMIYEDSGYVPKSYKRYLAILRNFLAFSFAEGLLFMHNGCASTLHSFCKFCVPIQSVFFKCSLNVFPKGFACPHSRAASKGPT